MNYIITEQMANEMSSRGLNGSMSKEGSQSTSDASARSLAEAYTQAQSDALTAEFTCPDVVVTGNRGYTLMPDHFTVLSGRMDIGYFGNRELPPLPGIGYSAVCSEHLKFCAMDAPFVCDSMYTGYMNGNRMQDVVARYHLDAVVKPPELTTDKKKIQSMYDEISALELRMNEAARKPCRGGVSRVVQGGKVLLGVDREEIPFCFIEGAPENRVWKRIIPKVEQYLDVHSLLMLRQTCVVLNRHKYALNTNNELCFRGFRGYNMDVVVKKVLPLASKALNITEDAALVFDFSQCYNFKDISVVQLLSNQAKLNNKFTVRMRCKNMRALVLDYCNQITDNALEILLATKLPNLEKLSIVCCRNENLTGKPFIIGLSSDLWPRFTKFNCSFSNITLDAIEAVARFIHNTASNLDGDTLDGRLASISLGYTVSTDSWSDSGNRFAQPSLSAKPRTNELECSSSAGQPAPNAVCQLEISGCRGSRRFLEKHGFGTELVAFASAVKTKTTKLCATLSRRVQNQLEESANGDSEDQDPCLRLLMHRGSELLVNCPIVEYDPHSGTDVWTLPISIAIHNDDILTCNLLIRRGARINIWDYCGKSPLYKACELGRVGLAKLFLKMEHAPVSAENTDLSPISACVRRGNTELLSRLLKVGVQLNTRFPHIRSFKSPLYIACEYKSDECIRMLLENGADPNWCYHGRVSTTMLAYSNDSKWLPVFVKYGAGRPANKRFVLTDVLSCAIMRDDLDSVIVLVDSYPDLLNREHAIWSSPIAQAARLGKYAILEALIDRGASINQLDIRRMNAVHIACEEGRVECLNLLLSRKANKNEQDSRGRTPLYLAVLENKKDAVLALLRHDCDPNIAEFSNGETPLMAALRTRNEDIAQLIIENAGLLRLDVADKLGRSACIYALYFERICTGELILRKCALQGLQASSTEIRWFNAVLRDRLKSSCVRRQDLRRFANHYRRLNSAAMRESGIGFVLKKRWHLFNRLVRKFRGSEAKAKLASEKREAQERKARKKLLKSSKECDISQLLKRYRYTSSSTDKGKLVECVGGRPSPRASATFTCIPGSDVAILFGGEFYDGVQVEVSNDAFIYNPGKNEWRLVETVCKPPPRCAHQATIFNNYLYIFGGEYSTLNQFHHFNDMHRLCLKSYTWEPVQATGQIPTPRSGHRMVTWNGYWVLFGGFHDTIREITYYNDLYLFSFKDRIWKRVCQRKFPGATPEPRAACLMLAPKNSNKVLVFGGFTKTKDTNKNVSGQYHQDSWLINMDLALQPDVLVWEKISTKGKPSYSIGFGFANYKTFGVVFGGVSDTDSGGTSLKSTFYNSCYTINVDQKRWYPLTIADNAVDEALEEDTLAQKMSAVSLSANPPPRMNPHVFVCGSVMYVYGGIVDQGSVEMTLSDMWSLDLVKRDVWKCVDQGYNFRDIYKGEFDIDEDSSSEDELDDEEDVSDEDEMDDEMLTDESSSEDLGSD
ncbi:Kelch domain-containing protein 4 [Babesia sp. Xinjiang]|uniref:Kelch domain-containing protein 4 n=1 Tax=Babesia sp. Xinjiang TaxID=462227 RepID=UPI000A220B86|nr:Kelch domain-containing protein 4 [Babesia sp. Xinjiang]ORM39986.1 Kelch domain-containing protein 4 [Babesia sp. Xinjiang]